MTEVKRGRATGGQAIARPAPKFPLEGEPPMNVAAANVNQPRPWVPSPVTVQQILAAVQREAYPPAGRSGVGTVLRRAV